jgi:hypothetical protein
MLKVANLSILAEWCKKENPDPTIERRSRLLNPFSSQENIRFFACSARFGPF